MMMVEVNTIHFLNTVFEMACSECKIIRNHLEMHHHLPGFDSDPSQQVSQQVSAKPAVDFPAVEDA